MTFVSLCWYRGVRGAQQGCTSATATRFMAPAGRGRQAQAFAGVVAFGPFWRSPRLWSSCSSSPRVKRMPKPRTETLPDRAALPRAGTLPDRAAPLRAETLRDLGALGTLRDLGALPRAGTLPDRAAPLRATVAAARSRAPPTTAAA